MPSVSDWDKNTSGLVQKALTSDGSTRPVTSPQNAADLLGNLYQVLLVFISAEGREPHGDGDDQFWSAVDQSIKDFRTNYERPAADPDELNTPHGGDSKIKRG